MESISLGAAAIKLSNKILGYKTEDMVDILKELASEVGLLHIAYARMARNKSWDSTMLTAIATYSKEWQRRYFYKQYFLIDPILNHGKYATSSFDWLSLVGGNSAVDEFFDDANRHNVGSNGISIPVRNRRDACAVVSFSNNLSSDEWEQFKTNNMIKLNHLSALIDSAALIGSKLPITPEVNLSLREEECLIWAARGKTYNDIAELLNLSFHSVRNHLDMARRKLHGTNLTHAVAVAMALGVIPELTLRE